MKKALSIIIALAVLLASVLPALLLFSSFAAPTYAAEELFLTEQINYDIQTLGVVVICNGRTRAFIDRSQKNGALYDNTFSFQAGSMARLVTSLALMRLLSEKGIALDSPIEPYMPAVASPKDFEGISFMDLLLHTTGYLNNRFETISSSMHDCYSLRDRELLYISKAEQRFEPGKYSLISKSDFAIMGLLIEKIAAKPYEAYMADFFSAIGMNSSFIPSCSKDHHHYDKMPNVDEIELVPRFFYSGGKNIPAQEYHAVLPASDDFVTRLEDMEALLNYMLNDIPKDFQVFSKVFTNINVVTARSTALNYVELDGIGLYLLDSSLPGATERIFFVPKLGIAAFIYYNSDSTEARESLTKAIIELCGYDEKDAIKREFETGPVEIARDLVGYYSPVNISSKNLEKLTGFLHQLKINKLGDGITIGDDYFESVTPTLLYSQQADKFARIITDDQGHMAYIMIDNNLYERRISSNIQLMLISLFVLVTALLIIMDIARWDKLIAGRVDDRPRVWVLFAQLIYIINLTLTYFAARGATYWGIAYGHSVASRILLYSGWGILIGTALTLWTLSQTKRDYKWGGFFRFLIWLSLPLSVFYIFWLWKFNLVIRF